MSEPDLGEYDADLLPLEDILTWDNAELKRQMATTVTCMLLSRNEYGKTLSASKQYSEAFYNGRYSYLDREMVRRLSTMEHRP